MGTDYNVMPRQCCAIGNEAGLTVKNNRGPPCTNPSLVINPAGRLAAGSARLEREHCHFIADGGQRMGSRFRLPLGLGRLRRAAIAVAAAPPLALALFAVPFATPAAPVAEAFPPCPIDHLCTWQNSNYMGTNWNFTITTHTWYYVGAGANDKISSLYWNNYFQTFGYIAKNCPADSQWTYINTQGTAPNLANNKWPNQTGMNDSISAYAIGGGTRPTFPAHGSRISGGC